MAQVHFNDSVLLPLMDKYDISREEAVRRMELFYRAQSISPNTNSGFIDTFLEMSSEVAERYVTTIMKGDEPLIKPQQANAMRFFGLQFEGFPTLSVAANLLRSHGLHVSVQPDWDEDGQIVWHSIVWVMRNKLLNPQPHIVRENGKMCFFETHDMALSAGITSALKL